MPELETRQAVRPVLVSRLASWVVVAVLAMVVAVIWWARNRGFDLTDEGYYLLLYGHPEAVPPGLAVSQFYRLVELLTGSADIGIAGYRVLGLSLLTISGGFFGLAFARFVRARLPEIVMPPALLTVTFVAIAGLLGYSWAPLAVSYNTLAAALVHLAAGFVLLALASSDKSKTAPGSIAYAVVAGGCLPFLFYVKWPTAVVLSTVLAIFVLMVAGRDGLRLLVGIAAGGVAVFALVTRELLAGPFSLASVFESAANAPSSAYQPAELLKNYALWIVGDTLRVLWQDPLRVLALVVLIVGRPLTGIVRGWIGWVKPWMLPTAAAVYLVAEIPGASYLDRLTNFKLVAALVVALGLSVFIAQTLQTGQLPDFSIRKLSRNGRMAWLLALLCLALPLVTAFGSNSHVLTSSLHGGAGYGAAVIFGVAVVQSSGGDRARIGRSVALAVLAVGFAAQVVNGVVFDPYRLVASRVEQTNSVSAIPQLEGILFDAPSAEFLSEVNRLVTQETSFVPGDHVLAFASIPGLVHMVDGILPGAPWIRPPESNEQGEVCSVLRLVPTEVAATTLILQNSAPSTELALCLQELLPGYPERFVEVGGVAIPSGYGAGNSLGETLSVLELEP